VRAQPSSRGLRNLVSPRLRLREGAGAAIEQGAEKPGFPTPPTRWEGLGGLRPPKNNCMFIAAVCGGAAWTADMHSQDRGSWKRAAAGQGGFLYLLCWYNETSAARRCQNSQRCNNDVREV